MIDSYTCIYTTTHQPFASRIQTFEEETSEEEQDERIQKIWHHHQRHQQLMLPVVAHQHRPPRRHQPHQSHHHPQQQRKQSHQPNQRYVVLLVIHYYFYFDYCHFFHHYVIPTTTMTRHMTPRHRHRHDIHIPVVIPQQKEQHSIDDDDNDGIDDGEQPDDDDIETPATVLQEHSMTDYDRFWELLYDTQCDNPIIHRLCQSGIELIRMTKRQRETCDLLVAHHLTLEDLPPSQKRARVEQMIRLARDLGQTSFSTFDIKHFKDILAPTPTPTDTNRRYRRRKRPVAPAKRGSHEEQHQGEESTVVAHD